MQCRSGTGVSWRRADEAMKPEQLEIDRLRREVTRLKAERRAIDTKHVPRYLADFEYRFSSTGDTISRP
jgi:hypothetical protein